MITVYGNTFTGGTRHDTPPVCVLRHQLPYVYWAVAFNPAEGSRQAAAEGDMPYGLFQVVCP